MLKKYDEQPPTTWDDLERIGQKIQDAERKKGNDRFWGFVFQGKAYEGLTCNALEWVNSHNGGLVVEPDGEISINNQQAAKAFGVFYSVLCVGKNQIQGAEIHPFHGSECFNVPADCSAFRDV